MHEKLTNKQTKQEWTLIVLKYFSRVRCKISNFFPEQNADKPPEANLFPMYFWWCTKS